MKISFLINFLVIIILLNCSPVKKESTPSDTQAPEVTPEKNTGEKDISFMTSLFAQYPQYFDSIIAKKRINTDNIENV